MSTNTPSDDLNQIIALAQAALSKLSTANTTTSTTTPTQTSTTPTSYSLPTLKNKRSLFWLWQDVTNQLNLAQQLKSSLNGISAHLFDLSQSGTLAPSGLSPNPVSLAQAIRTAGFELDILVQNNQKDSTGINALLSSSTLQEQFINDTVSAAKTYGAQVIDIDFEPASNIQNVAQAYAQFLGNLANALHAAGVRLNVDFATWNGSQNLWNLQELSAQSGIDFFTDMMTYDASMTNVQNALNNNLKVVGSRYVMGILTVTDDPTIVQRLALAQSSGINSVAIWPSYGSFIPSSYDTPLANFLTASQPTVSSAPAAVIPYTIQAGDTLTELATKYNTSIEAIVTLNPTKITDPSVIQVKEQILIAPNSQVYTVQANDSLYSIAQAYKITLAQIEALNPQIANPSLISVGQSVVIPLG